jgi:O-antigen ligase
MAVPFFAAATGVAFAFEPRVGIALLLSAIFVPIVAINLPLAVVAWFPLVFLEGLPAFNLAGKAGGLLITAAWLATLRSWFPTRQEAPVVLRRILVASAALLTWFTMSLFWAADANAVLGDLWHWYAVVLLMLVVATTMRTAGMLRLMLWAFVIGAALAVAEGLVGGGLTATTANELGAGAETRLGGAQGDPNFLAAGIVPAMVLSLTLMVTSKSGLVRLSLGGLLGLLGFGLLASESRGGLIAVATAILAAFIFFRQRRAALGAFTLALIAFAGVWASISPAAWERVTSFGGGGSGRDELWAIALRITGDNPVFGVGLSNYPVVSADYVRQPGALTRVDLILDEAQVVHNVYLELAAEVGIVGLGLFLLVAILSLYAAWRAATGFERRHDDEMATVSRGVLVAGIGLLTSSVFISNGVDKRLWVLFGIGAALFALSRRRSTVDAGENAHSGDAVAIAASETSPPAQISRS